MEQAWVKLGEASTDAGTALLVKWPTYFSRSIVCTFHKETWLHFN